MTDENSPPTDRFAASRISRRTFVRLSVATAGALALPGNATADVSADTMSAEYEYVVNHTPTDYAVPTLVTFSEESGLDDIASLDLDAALETTSTPQPAAYGQFTATESAEVADLPTAETLSHSPGSNPFWRLGYYPLGVFPEAKRSVDYVDYEQMIDGIGHLQEENADRMRYYSIGTSPGHYNEISGRVDPKDVYVVEITNDIEDQTAFEEKTKVFYSLSLHGLERAGAEAGSRYIEKLLRGGDPEIEQLLDDLVLIFCYTNPDGWVARHPQYESGYQLVGPDDGVPVVPMYERGNAGVYDTNRQYPTVGWITPAHYPGEPDDPAERSLDKVTDALTIVDHFRGYENLDYGADMHGMLNAKEFVLGLISQDQFDSRQLHELYQMCRVIDDDLESALETWVTAADLQKTITGDTNVSPQGFGVLPEQAFDYAGIWDTIDYTVTGAMGDWMAHPEEFGGLGMTTMDFEMAYSHMVGTNVYHPEIVEMQVTGYQTAIQTIARYAYENSDTPNSTDEFDTSIETGGDRVAYVTTDGLTRSSDDLSFTLKELDSYSASGTIGPGATGAETTAEETFHTVDLEGSPTKVQAELSWTPEQQDLEFYLEDPDGNRIGAAATADNPETISADLAGPGQYTFIAETWANAASTYEINATFLGPGESSQTTTTSSSTDQQQVAGDGVATSTFDVPSGLSSFSAHVHAHDALLETELVAPSGEVVRSENPLEGGHAIGGRCCDQEAWEVKRPEAGTWTVRMENLKAEPAFTEVRYGTLGSSGPNPDPVRALGYEQTDYEVTPFEFFEDLAGFLDSGSVEPVTIDEVANGALANYDHAVVIHNFGGEQPAYVDALDAFVENDGNLVLTDTGLNLLGKLQNTLAADVQGERVSPENFYIGHLGEKDPDHPLLEDTRPIQQALWKMTPLGYSTSNEAPMTLVDVEAFEEAAGGAAVPSIAGTTDGRISAGSLTWTADDRTGIHCIGSLLPPASQSNLHPFGMLDYSVSFLGYLVLTNAMGFTQVRTMQNGLERVTFGGGDFSVDPVEAPQEAFSVSGQRHDDGSVFTAGQTNHLELSVTPTDRSVVRDYVPDGWTVLEAYSEDVDRVEGNYVYFTKEAIANATTNYSYFVECPDSTGTYDFGPVEVNPTVREGFFDVSGTDETNLVVGVDTN
ncbi:M14 family zinc carboxypeptidase [Haladaptatus sp. YSMS36]|uniref:M14 family zinc carboxypeptidase n=1 Tax=Haladaptatus sp. YSMS36 TaxID=3033384 RepID=UPI0023E8E4EA|nr:M14 family zinc carboxypeptidase [Haladaptatus sp. YSMS36]